MRACIFKCIFAFLCLLLPLCAGVGLCMPASAEALPLNERIYMENGEKELTVATSAAGQYILAAFPQAAAFARVYAGAEEIASGQLPLTVSLPQESEIRVSLSGEADYYFEIMRASRGRNAYAPTTITAAVTDRTITRAQDVHWLEFVSETGGEYIFRVRRAEKSGVYARISLFDAEGNALGSVFSNENSQSAVYKLSAGERVLMRVSAEGGATGSYTLACVQNEERLAHADLVSLGRSISMKTGEWRRLMSSLPISSLIFESSNPEIAFVNAEGVITALKEGECSVSVRTFDCAPVFVSVSVAPAEITGVEFLADALQMSPGEMLYAAYRVLPAYAAPVEITFTSMDESIASVNASGAVTAHRLGETTLRVQTAEGGFSAEMTIIVKAPDPLYRALIVGIASYEGSRERTGSINTTQGMADALSRSFDGSGYLTSMYLDLTKSELFEAIESTFFGASDADVSLFYINCHGGVTATVPWLEMRSGEKITARELEGALRKVPGTVVVIIDCCMSGAFIGQAGEADAFSSGIVDLFGKTGGGKNTFLSGKYKVLVSSSYDQNSYRIASSAPATEQNMATVFARSLAEGLGWNLIKDAKGPLKADLDNDRQISLHEAWMYAAKRSMSFLQQSTARQTVQVWPRGDAFILLKSS